MTQIRLLVAQILAGVTFLMTVIYTLGFYDSSLTFGLGRISALSAIALSILAFITSLRLKSNLVAGFLILGGIIMQIAPIQALIASGAIRVPGPIYGVLSFSPLLILGIVKALTSRKNRLSKPNNKQQTAINNAAMDQVTFRSKIVRLLPQNTRRTS
jgi:hypothetical protein